MNLRYADRWWWIERYCDAMALLWPVLLGAAILLASLAAISHNGV